MAASNNDRRRRVRAIRLNIFAMIASFLRLFDKPTRVLIVSCVVFTVASLCVIVPKGPSAFMDGQSSTSIAQAGGSSSAAARSAASSGSSSRTKHALAVPAAVDDGSDNPSWMLPSGGDYVDLSQVDDLNIRVSIADQKVYVKSGDTVVYTMICSTGMDGSTPTGSYTVQNRGEDFFNSEENMGARYWVSWANYGEYLFHTVPTDQDGEYIVAEAEKLGVPASHGCVRLSVADAKWLYEQLPGGTPVVIE
ncbi:L,D-transpeptidase [Bifidobacterium vansinderenii]|uniref:Peptidase n=1 Tax=Bifidobacterium vansinderenii TaxID=1984871 RepID=A0A229VUJ2_9BIFI|nr:L,D-transpeptidase [Bifidobacterium vansinderenii]OXM99261.1 peptidase [Bifidobacterium vansinderenii]